MKSKIEINRVALDIGNNTTRVIFTINLSNKKISKKCYDYLKEKELNPNDLIKSQANEMFQTIILNEIKNDFSNTNA